MYDSLQTSEQYSDAIDAAMISTLSPLPPSLQQGLMPVTFFGFLSFIASTALFLILTWRIMSWTRKSRSTSQFVLLIYNLVVADFQQSLAFLLNIQWLLDDGIYVDSSACLAQGWFVSTGDMASGVFCFSIGLHTLASVIFNYRLSNTNFALVLLLLWAMIYGFAIAGLVAHPDDFYVRAVAWCWINPKYRRIRLWLHYFWIFVFEFGTVLIYLAIWLGIQYRIKTNFYAANSKQATHARTAAKLMIVYPITYVFCTLPLATLRMINMNALSHDTFRIFCFAGAMITSNGWIDVLLYSLTRRIMLFSDEPPEDDYDLDTFQIPFTGIGFGTKTTCEFTGSADPRKPFYSRVFRRRASVRPDAENQKQQEVIAFDNSSENLVLRNIPSPNSTQGSKSLSSGSSTKSSEWTTAASAASSSSMNVKTQTTVEVRSDLAVELKDLNTSNKSSNEALNHVKPPSATYHDDFDGPDFLSKPSGWD